MKFLDQFDGLKPGQKQVRTSQQITLAPFRSPTIHVTLGNQEDLSFSSWL